MAIRFLFLAILFPFFTQAQPENMSLYPQNYFRNPLNIPILLAGNFGECRANHFHSGLDIKTEGRENLPVHAAADGYVSRIKMEKGGFGHALYITHPDGFTTVYAHLNRFTKLLQEYTLKTQYEKESWAVDISMNPGQFPVKKGQQIAWSGNTGGSAGPHLHFEIRDTKTEHPLNPLLFGLPVNDTRSPVPTQLSVYNLHQSIYNQEAHIVNMIKKGNSYTTEKEVISINTNKAGIGVRVNDFMNGSRNTLNFYTAKWYLDDSLMGSIRLDDIGYEETRYLHAYVDYKLRKQKRDWFQLLFQLPGNKLSHIYPFLNAQKGILFLKDEQPHRVKIELKDAKGNTAIIAFNIKSSGEGVADDCARLFPAKKINTIQEADIKFSLDGDDLYDDVCFRLEREDDAPGFSNRFKVHYPYVPVHTYFDLNIKPNKFIPFALRDKIVLMYSEGKNDEGKAAKFSNGWYKAAVRNFGTYWLEADTTAPVITALQKQNADLSKAKQLRFRVQENQTSVKKFRAELDGKWLCFEPRGNVFFYDFDEHCSEGKHELVITANDENDNISTFVYHFTR